MLVCQCTLCTVLPSLSEGLVATIMYSCTLTFQAMKARHWERIANLTEHMFDVESDSFFLRNIMEAPILPNKDDIEVSY